MAEFPPPQSSAVPAMTPVAPVTPALVVYALFAVAAVAQLLSSGIATPLPLMSLIGIVGVIIAHVKRSDARGTWVESHFSWQIRTFWWSFVWSMIGWLILIVLGIILIGIPIAFLIWAAVSIWVLYRVIRGYLQFKENKPIPGM
jgi:uncharacterized membrane protein